MISDLSKHAHHSALADPIPLKSTPKKLRYFFVIISIVVVVIALLGFVPSYQESATYPIHWFAHIHGALMTGWLLIFTTQSLLAARGMVRFHRQFGLWSVAVGILVWISMWIASARALVGYNPPVDHFLYDVLIMQFYGILLFGLFFSWGIMVKENKDAHKRLMYLATIVLIQAAIDRMHWLPALHASLFVRFIYLDSFLVALIIYDILILKRVHQMTLIGTAITIVTQFVVTMIWGSGPWHKFWFNLVQWFLQ